MPDQGLSMALPDTKAWGAASSSSPSARTDGMTGSDYSSRRTPDAALSQSGTEHIVESAMRSTPTPAGLTRLCSICRCRLSQYNREDLCAGCSRDNRHQAQTVRSVPMGIWQLPDIRQALVNREFGRMCQLIRQNGEIRQDDIAALTGLSQAFLSMLESGARKLTNIDKIIQLLDGLQAPPELTGPMLRPSIHHQLRGSVPAALPRR